MKNATLRYGKAPFGGAIYNNQGSLIVRNSTFRENYASMFGGAINSAYGHLTIERSSIFDNAAGASGGGIAIDSRSGGSATVNNTTLSANAAGVAGGGIIVFGGDAAIAHSTLYENSAHGLYRADGRVFLFNSIIAASDSNAGDCFGGLYQSDGNYIADGTCGATLTGIDGDIRLGGLVGSPAYHPLQFGSPAIDAAASQHCRAFDQAGRTRPSPAGGRCDIGAHELQQAPPTATFTPTLAQA